MEEIKTHLNKHVMVRTKGSSIHSVSMDTICLECIKKPSIVANENEISIKKHIKCEFVQDLKYLYHFLAGSPSNWNS